METDIQDGTSSPPPPTAWANTVIISPRVVWRRVDTRLRAVKPPLAHPRGSSLCCRSSGEVSGGVPRSLGPPWRRFTNPIINSRVGKSDDIKSVNYIFGSSVSTWKEVGRVDWWMMWKKVNILNFFMNVLILIKKILFKRHQFLIYPLYSLAV